jgi:hypothetical protein
LFSIDNLRILLTILLILHHLAIRYGGPGSWAYVEEGELWRLLTKPAITLAPSESKAPSNLAIAGFALVMGVLTFVVRIWLPVGWEFILLGFQFPFFVQYIALFIVGILAYRRDWFSGLSDAQGKVWLRLILVGSPPRRGFLTEIGTVKSNQGG